MALSPTASKRNADARAVLAIFYSHYESVRHRRFSIDADDANAATLGMTRDRYRAAAERLVEKGLLKRHGQLAHMLEPYGVEASEDDEDLEALLPVLRETSAVAEPEIQSGLPHVEHALADAKAAIEDGRPGAAVDRLHTALHGRARELCSAHRIELPAQASLPQAYSALCAGHPGGSIAHAESERILRSLGAVIEALNKLRNHASLAHPSELLDNADAHLAINATRTIMTYLEARFPAPELP